MSVDFDLDSLANEFQNFPDKFLRGNDGCADAIKKCTKGLYDNVIHTELPPQAGLPHLIIKGFDDEQIWQQLDVRNAALYKHFLKLTAEVVSQKDKLLPPSGESPTAKRKHDDDEEEEAAKKPERRKVKKVDREEKKKKRKVYKSVVDDTFFKLSELEEFLNLEDAKESKKMLQDGDDEESDEDEDELDLYDENLGRSKRKKKEDQGVTAKFSDFFDAPEDEGGDTKDDKTAEDEEDAVEESSEEEMGEEDEGLESEDIDDDQEDVDEEKPKKSVRFNLEDDESEDSESEQGESAEEGETAEEILGRKEKSSFEKRQERLKERIAELEEASIAEKPWQLKGETTSSTRPENALLEENLEYENTTRPAPLITEEITERIESLIRQRIKDKVFDDVERKVKPVEDPYDYKKRMTLNQEKSKQSLSQIYEQEYLKQQQDEKEETTEKPKAHEEIETMMESLFSKLDALSNFHFTPKSSVAEVKIVSNLPVVSVEEVTPTTVSDAQLLAPQEVADKQKRPLVGTTEKTKTDRKHDRREKKKKQRLRKKEQEKREKLVKKMKPGMGNKYSKLKALKELEKLAKAGGAVVKGKENMRVKSSTQFFAKLQDEASSFKNENRGKKKKESLKHKSSAKIKL